MIIESPPANSRTRNRLGSLPGPVTARFTWCTAYVGCSGTLAVHRGPASNRPWPRLLPVVLGPLPPSPWPWVCSGPGGGRRCALIRRSCPLGGRGRGRADGGWAGVRDGGASWGGARSKGTRASYWAGGAPGAGRAGEPEAGRGRLGRAETQAGRRIRPEKQAGEQAGGQAEGRRVLRLPREPEKYSESERDRESAYWLIGGDSESFGGRRAGPAFRFPNPLTLI